MYAYTRTLEALIARHAGRTEETLEKLDQAHVQVRYARANNSPLYDQALNRYIRTEALFAERRFAEAVPWYQSMLDSLYTWGVLYVGSSYPRRAQIYEQLGDDEKAIDFYTRFIDVWQEADPELQSYVEDARQRLSHLLEATVREPDVVADPRGTP